MTSPTHSLFNRKCTLTVTNAAGDGLDLSNFRIIFSTEAADSDHPNAAVIRVYNLKPETVSRIRNEFQVVSLQAGYDPSPFAVIFFGTIKQLRYGKEDAVTSFVDMMCGDGDIYHNNALIATSLSKGHTPQQQVSAVIASMNTAGQTANPGSQPLSLATGISVLIGGTKPAPRGKVMFGAAPQVMRSTAASLRCSWSIQNGVMQVIPYDSYLPTEAVVMSQYSGVVGIPEVTNEGIKIKCLLNPLLQVGGTIRLDNDLINTIISASGNEILANGGATGITYNTYGKKGQIAYNARVANDGLYRIYVIEYEGDTRGQKWYANLTCLAVDASTQKVVINPTGG